MDKQELVNAVIEEMKKDINIHNDWTAIDAFLYNVDTKLLQGFLPEEDDKAQLPRVYYHSWMTGPQGAVPRW